MTTNEQKIIRELKKQWSEFTVTRRSEREYDLSIEGKYSSNHRYMPNVQFSGWLPLIYIRELSNWTSQEIAEMTDHPTMVTEGDWSGVRDSDPERIWEIFHYVAG
jgi:hypothetical protein